MSRIAMLFLPQQWSCRLGVAARWKAEVDDNGLHVKVNGTQLHWPALYTKAPTIRRGWFWSHVTLPERLNSVYELNGLSHENAERLVTTLALKHQTALDSLKEDIQADHDRLSLVWSELKREIYNERYLAARDRDRICRRIAPLAAQIQSAVARTQSPHAQNFPATEKLAKVLEPLKILSDRCADVLYGQNLRFIEQELTRWREFFAHCEERALTREQACAAITFEENTLLVAAAGSGKTSTIVGKVAYALAKGIAQPEEILCLAFNQKAAKEIGKRLEVRLEAMVQPDCPIDPEIKTKIAAIVGGAEKVDARTFHSLGSMIIRKVEGRHTVVSSEKENSSRISRAIECCKDDPLFSAQWLILQTTLRYPRPADSRFHNEEEYLDYLRGIWQQRKSKQKSPVRGNNEGILTLGCTKSVRSLEEVAISNWLFIMGVKFEYEANFVEGAQRLCPGKVWTPDFIYRAKDAQGEYLVVHEHFALNEEGKAPRFFRDPDGYVTDAQEKMRVLREMGVRHFFTTSAEYVNGTLFQKMDKELRAAGVAMQPRTTEEVLARLRSIGLNVDNNMIEQAVSQIRENGWDLATLESRLAGQPERYRARLFIEVAWVIAQRVNELLIADKQLDFGEMIRRALVYVDKTPNLLPYKLILADEFQDTAPGRGELMRRLLHDREDSLFFAVGDDWQAINRFAGSDLRYFRQFGEKFNRRAGSDERCDLTQTFRSNQGIADVARTFVLKNASQMPKEVNAADKRREGVVDVRLYNNDSEALSQVEETLARWVSEHPRGQKPSVFILGRYGETRIGTLTSEQIQTLNKTWADRINLIKHEKETSGSMYMTMHRSKGLQADYVLIIGLHSVEHDWFCFPSEREDDPLLKIVLPPTEALVDADERRLFYVALTRAKHQVVLLAPNRHPSRYVMELLRDQRDGSVLFNGTNELPPKCTACKTGLILLRYNPKTEKSFHACHNRHECGKTWAKMPPNAVR